MNQVKTQLQQINAVLDLLAEVNQILTYPAVQADAFQKMQYERQKQQYVTQLTDLLGSATQPLIISQKRSSSAA